MISLIAFGVLAAMRSNAKLGLFLALMRNIPRRQLCEILTLSQHSSTSLDLQPELAILTSIEDPNLDLFQSPIERPKWPPDAPSPPFLHAFHQSPPATKPFDIAFLGERSTRPPPPPLSPIKLSTVASTHYLQATRSPPGPPPPLSRQFSTKHPFHPKPHRNGIF